MSADPIGGPEAWRSAVDLDRLRSWLDAQGLGHGEIESAQPLTGGTQNILIHLRRTGLDAVLRRPPAHARAYAGGTIVREARVLRALAGSAVPHPQLIAGCDDPAVLGAPFYLMAPVDGFNPSGRPLPALHAGDPALRHRMGLAMVDALLRLGEVDVQAVGLADFGRPEGFLQRQVARWRSHLAACDGLTGWPGASELPAVAEVGTWLDDHRPEPSESGLLHGDFHLSNVMFRPDGPELAAVIDWELATLGDPLLDLGWLLATWPDASGQGAGTIHVTPWGGFPDTDELLARYAAGSRRSLHAIGWYVVLARYKLGILLESSYARACAGRSDATVGQRHHESAVRLLRAAARHIDAGV